MALKDLVSSAASAREEDIEEIVGAYIRYDVDEPTLVLTTAASELGNKSRVLVLLTANEGWNYIDPDIKPIQLKPKLIEELTAIAGGTLRPLLRGLAAKRLVKSETGSYRLVLPNLAKTKEIVAQNL